MLEILVLTPTPSFPQNQGNRKGVFAFTKEFQNRGARIHFLYVPTEWYGGFSPDEHIVMSDEWDIFHAIPLSKKWEFKTDNEVFGVDEIWDSAIDVTINWWKKQVNFDAVVCHYVFLSKALELFPEETYKIIYTHDRFSDRKEMLEQHNIPPEYFYTSQIEEKKAFDRADLVIAVKEEEAQFFRKLTDTEVVSIGHFGAPDILVNKPGNRNTLTVGFIGSENSINITNLNNFFDKYLSKLEDTNNVQFIIAGKICDVWSIESPIIKILGRVEAVKDFYEQVDFVIIPFEFSTGIKIKAIEAMAHSTGVLMTKNASEGIPTSYREHNYDGLEEIYNGLLEMSENRQKTAELAKKSEIVYNNLRDDISQKIDAIFTRIINKI